MRFPKETRALIQGAAPHSVTIPWPAGEREPQKGRLYWLQSIEDAKEAEEKEKRAREHSPETCREVMAGMHRRRHGKDPESFKPKKRPRSIARPKAGDDRITVIDTTILDIGWEAKVALYVDPDPVNHSGVKARVPAGPNPIFGHNEPTETEPEQIVSSASRSRRLEEEEALKLEHRASVDHSAAMKAEQTLLNQRRRGKRSKLKEEATTRALRRADLVSAEAVA